MAAGSGPGRRSAGTSSRLGYPPPQRRRLTWLRGLLALAIAAVLVDLVTTPWIFHIGGRFTPLTEWDGYGTVRASNGGHYVLFTHLQGGLHGLECGLLGCDTLQGTAKICTERGGTYTFGLAGKVHAWWSTDGAKTSIDLQNVKSGPLPDGWVIAFTGSWQGGRLVVENPDNSFTEVLTARGAVRRATSKADAGNASVSLHHGSGAAFDRACHALAG